jgi:molybdate transport system permease protein
MIWEPIRLSLQVLLVAVPLILLIGLSLAVLLTRTRFRGQLVLETVIMLPLVLPPTALGYALLRGLGAGSPLREWIGLDLLFTWQAAAIAATVAGIPLMFQAARTGLLSVNRDLENAARSLGSGPGEVLFRVTLPLANRGIIAGLVLATLRALGEFGATVMIAGNIPGRTQTMSLAVYDAVQIRNFDVANMLVVIMVGFSFVGLVLARQLSR